MNYAIEASDDGRSVMSVTEFSLLPAAELL
ncbi:hypothetical protein OF001_U190027 [Pseudomonas sp. OF001]|nr:hypothetical protein OF001_U190027 [Pseudomonas sp. OF001]